MRLRKSRGCSGPVASATFRTTGWDTFPVLLTDPNWKRRVYGARTIVNTYVYRLTGSRLPGFWGDTLYQAQRPLRRYYRRAGLQLIEVHASRQFAAAPVFIYHTVRRTPEPGSNSSVRRAGGTG